jgi:cell division septal protein FtsQ
MDTKRIAIRIVYWLVVLVVSLLLVFALVMLFESLDDSSVGGGVVPAAPLLRL